MYTIETAKVGKYEVTVEIDEMAESPRTAYDEFGTFYTALRRYQSPDPYVGGMFDAIARDLDLPGEYDDVPELVFKALNRTSHIILPVWKYEHGNIMYRAAESNPFGCEWDSGMAGFIFVHADKVREEFGVKRISPKLRKRVEDLLRGEVKTYSDWANGEVYAFVVRDGLDVVEAGCGFYGDVDDCLAEGLAVARYHAAADRRARDERLKELIRHKVPLGKRAEILAELA